MKLNIHSLAIGVSLLGVLSTTTAATSQDAAQAVPLVSRVGAEFRANSITKYYQEQPTVAALSNGNFVVAWRDDSGTAPDKDVGAIRARLFTPDGLPVAKEFIVNSQTRFDQFTPKAAAYAGGFVIIFGDDSMTGADASGYAISGRRFTNAGAPIGNQFTVNQVSKSNQYNPAISSIPGGGFIASWDDWSGTNGDGDGNEPAVRGTVYNANGGRVAPDTRYNTTTKNNQSQSAVAGLSTGDSVAVWMDVSQIIPEDTDFGSVIRGQLIGANGHLKGPEFVVNTNLKKSQLLPAVAGLKNGNYVVVWKCEFYCTNDTQEYELHGQIWSSTTAKKIGGEFIVPATLGYPSYQQAAVVGFPNGRFMVVWTDFSATAPDYSESAIRAQIYQSNGVRLGLPFVVNLVKANAQEDPAVAILKNGNFVVVWSDWSDTRADQSPNIRGQVFHVNR